MESTLHFTARPPRYDESDLLGSAVRLAAALGPAAVTMAAVARECGAPSGWVYHRLPRRAVLLAELWLRTAGEFQAGHFAALASAQSRTTRAARTHATSSPGAGRTPSRPLCCCTEPMPSAGTGGRSRMPTARPTPTGGFARRCRS
ncbi:TetR/AcrR family transcriptional regulator [Streptomyces palmae]|uniref:TetR/AcrR family transcriptional regulator n=1 Tax=Streptomyces palmae TaxID=1701085 RepID=UPI0031582337